MRLALPPRFRFAPLVAALLAALSLPTSTLAAPADEEPAVDPKLFQALEFRNIGPYRGGRSTAVAGVIADPHTFYMGTTGGGVWKTTDSGDRWHNVSDGHFDTASIGAVAVAPSDPNVVYAGTGSACPRGNVSPGDGVYRSTDAGKSWTHVGLENAGQIGRIHVHPDDPDRAWVAVLGNIFGPNEERGVYRTDDGGASWERVLYVSERAGAVDLALDPTNPRILFAAVWEAERRPWTLDSGGDESGLYRSKDGGDTWEELTKGLPEGIKGRIGVTVSGANPDRIWALVEAEKNPGLYRSDNGGDSFRRVNSDRNYLQRAWYYIHVYADPQDANSVYVLNTGMYKSTDGGKSFSRIRTPHGDNHDLWIHPEHPEVMINANDGGGNVSHNGGATWSTQANQPTAEMYRVTVDGQFPYRIYGCQQDNSCVSLPSRTDGGGIGRTDWYVIGGCESGHVAIDPRRPEVTYSGCYGGQISRYDHATGHDREINIYPQLAIGQAPRDLRYRFQWNAPIRLSPHDPNVLYHTSQYVHRSTDEGQSWETISPDLTRDDETKQDYAGGPITRDNTGVEVYGTVFAFEESPHTAGLLWAGTDDGRVHLSRDNGANWDEITPKKMPEWGQVNMIELSAHDAGRAFLAVTRYKTDDFTPFIFRTDDYGASWKLLTDGANGIPGDHFVRVVREDPDRRGLLFAGTEFGLYASFDDGANWQRFEQGLPVSPVTDLAITEQDLVVATQGRSFWVLDDLTPLHRLDDTVAASDIHLFPPRPTWRYGGGGGFGGGGGGANPPGGVMIHYLLSEDEESPAAGGGGDEDDEAAGDEGGEPEGAKGDDSDASEQAPGDAGNELVLEILDAEGAVIRKLSSTKPEPRAPNPFRAFMPPGAGGSGKLTARAGMNRYVWNMRHHDAELVDDAVLWGIGRGPRVPPGTYQARLTRGDWSATTSFEIRKDPRLDTTQEDFEAQYELASEIWRSLSESHDALGRLRDVRRQMKDVRTRLEKAGKGEGLAEAAEKVNEGLAAIEKKIYQTASESTQDVLNFPPKLDNQLIALMGAVDSGDARPTAGAAERYADLRAELDAVLAELDTVIEIDLGAFNELAASKEMPAVFAP